MADTPQMPAILTDAEIADALRPLYQPEALAALMATPSLMADFQAIARAQAARSVREVLEQALELCQAERAERLEASEGPEGRLSDMAFGSVRAAERIAEKLGALAAEIQPPQKADSA